MIFGGIKVPQYYEYELAKAARAALVKAYD